MVARLRKKKIPLDAQDVNRQGCRRMCLKENTLLEDVIKENVDICSPGKSLSNGDLTGFLNEHLERDCPVSNRPACRTAEPVLRELEPGDILTETALEALQDNFRDLERRLTIQNRDCFIKDAHYSDDNLTRCRNSLLFELESMPDKDRCEKGNLRTAVYIPSVYQQLDPNWFFNPAFSIEDFNNIPAAVRPYYILPPEIPDSNNCGTGGEVSKMREDEFDTNKHITKIIPSSKLKLRVRGNSSVFEENLDYQNLLRNKPVDSRLVEIDDQVSLADSLEHCRSVKGRLAKRKKRLNRNPIAFPNQKD